MKIAPLMALMAVILSIIAIREIRHNRDLGSKMTALEAQLIENRKMLKACYPAPESELVEGKYYWCDAAVVDMWPDRVEKFLLLQEGISDGHRWRIVPDEKRLYRTDLQAIVGPGGPVYLVAKTNGIVSLKLMDRVPPALPTFRGP